MGTAVTPQASTDDLARRVGGRLCLDFVNTVHGRVSRSGARRARDYADSIVGERLISFDALLRWAELAGIVNRREARAMARRAAARPKEATAVLARAVALREALYRLFKVVLEGWPAEPADLTVLDRELRAARAHEQLVAAPRFGWRWAGEPDAPDRLLWPVLRSAVDLLMASELQRVRQCPGEACGWLFLDTSRSGRRQWCDMADCGNLAKVRRFRSRRQTR